MKKNTTIYCGILLCILVMAMSVVYIKNNKPHSNEINAILKQISIDDIINESDGVIIGSVKSSNTVKTDLYAKTEETNIAINTIIEIEKYLFNPHNLVNKEVVIQTLGGTIGNQSTYSDDMPIFNNNEKCLIFIKRYNDNLFNVYAWKLGKYDLDENNQLSNKNQFYQFESIFGKLISIDELEQILKSNSNL